MLLLDNQEYGKSTLTNKLLGEIMTNIGEISKKNKMGKNTTTEINTDTVVKAYTEKNKDESFGRKREFYNGFDLIFILNNGQRLVLLEGEIDKNNESAKLNYFLRDFFPGDYQDDKNKEPILIQMQTLTSQYKPINIDNKS